SDDHRETRAWWARQLEGMPRLELPFEHAHMNPSHAGASHHFTLPTELTAGLRALAARERCTLFQTLLAAWATLLARYSGQRDLGIATASSTRDRAELRDLFGELVKLVGAVRGRDLTPLAQACFSLEPVPAPAA